MADLSGLSSVSGAPLTETQIWGILSQIDLDITNLLRDGKLSALKYALPGAAGRTADRAGNLRALLEARSYYQALLTSRPGWEVSVGE
ncbi:hypothetical protein Pan258_10990 [Symmachiella dynata]|uniref:hypothetical protein n=1 Tax=Symmachiella dynata TaxID=2527995 RepID=UPI00118A49CB|nr:hypothetical protein [Symmachiella dynata]QDT47072.1 hypothetical protein Pan258_10990 [Symmachiella dynata]